MDVETMLASFLACRKELKTIRGVECDKCPLGKEVRLCMETPGAGVPSKITIEVNPCLLITEIAGKL